MNEEDKENVVKPGNLPGKGEKAGPDKGNEMDAPKSDVRIVDDKLIGDDRYLQDAIARKDSADDEVERDANY